MYYFLALCFGLSAAPQVFTRMFSLVSEWAHRWGIRVLQYPLCFVFICFSLEPVWLRIFSVSWIHASSRTSAVAIVPRSCLRIPLPYRLLHEPVVMVWSAHSHIGRCSCGDSGFIVWSALSFSWVSGCSAASQLVGHLDG